MQNISHIIYLMLENRSLDNVLGWLYENDKPSYVIPPHSHAAFHGLRHSDYNPGPTGVHHHVKKVAAGEYKMPTVDPHEDYVHVNAQLFNSQDNPAPNSPPTMMGFYIDYADQNPSATDQIMRAFTPEGLQVLSTLAKTFAVSDAYHSSIPTQTNCNRAFAATGNSIGNLNQQTTAMVDNHWMDWSDDSGPWDPVEFSGPTIWDVLHAHGYKSPHDWMIFYDESWPGHDLGDYCFTQDLFWPSLKHRNNHFADHSQFITQAAAGTLPTFSFLEPAWFEKEGWLGWNGTDYHPPDNVEPGEKFLARLFNAVLASPNWNSTLFIINFDEHGGTYDHVPPPWGAPVPWANPADGTAAPSATELGFGFDRFGVRVPLILVSPYIQAATVFRSGASLPYDHASVIATVLNQFNIPKSKWQLGSRVANAPTFENVLTLGQPRTDVQPLPVPPASAQVRGNPAPNDLQWLITRRMLVRKLQESKLPKEQFPALYERHFCKVETMQDLKTATVAMLRELTSA